MLKELHASMNTEKNSKMYCLYSHYHTIVYGKVTDTENTENFSKIWFVLNLQKHVLFFLAATIEW